MRPQSARWAAVAAGLAASEPATDDGLGAADARAHVQRIGAAVERARAALDAGAAVRKDRSSADQREDAAWAHVEADAAAVAARGVESQRHHGLDVSRRRRRAHVRSRVATPAASASPSAAACSGSARRVSRSTPEGEVKGVDPVKFIAT